MKPFCYAPFVHMYVSNTNKLCCVSNEGGNNKSDMDLKTKWESDYYKKHRKMFLSGIPSPHCDRCIQNEKVGSHSDRLMFEQMYHDKGLILNVDTGTTLGSPIDLDIRENNLCNLRCRMCSPSASSQLAKESNTSSLINFYGNDVYVSPKVSDDDLDFLLSNIEYGHRIKLLGGEPTIMPEVHNMLDRLIDRNVTDIPLFVTTNVTNNNPTFIRKIEKFSNVYFTFSIDGIGKTVEYIRNPLNWETAVGNMKVYSSIAQQSVLTYTVQAYNLLHIGDFLYWINEFDHNIKPRFEVLTNPEWASYRNIPYNIRKEYLEKLLKSGIINTDISKSTGTLRPVIQRCLEDNTEYDLKSFVNITKRFDVSRKQHIKDYIPQVWEIIQEDYNDLQI